MHKGKSCINAAPTNKGKKKKAPKKKGTKSYGY
jgi:hypothetical protein